MHSGREKIPLTARESAIIHNFQELGLRKNYTLSSGPATMIGNVGAAWGAPVLFS